MKLTLLDRSSYFKGLLLLIKQDNLISENEKGIIIKIGKTLGFDKSFIESAVKELLENEFITDEIPVFSDRFIAESFILDGLKVAFSDNEFSAEELEHLSNIAYQNGIDKEWLMLLISKYIKNSDELNTNDFLFVTEYLKNEKSEKVDLKS